MIGASASTIINFTAYAVNYSGGNVTSPLSARDASTAEVDLVDMYARLMDGKRLACGILWIIFKKSYLTTTPRCFSGMGSLRFWSVCQLLVCVWERHVLILDHCSYHDR